MITNNSNFQALAEKGGGEGRVIWDMGLAFASGKFTG